MIFKTGLVASAFSLTALTLAGCADAPDPAPVMDDHDHDHGHGEHNHAETLPEVLSELTELRDSVRDAFAKKDSEAAHGPLHDVGHLLSEVKELAGAAHLSDEAKSTIETNVATLLDAFGAVDKKMHSADEGSDYSEVSEKIDAAIDAIMAAAGPALTDDHDGDHDGHKDHDDDEKHDADHDKAPGHNKDATDKVDESAKSAESKAGE